MSLCVSSLITRSWMVLARAMSAASEELCEDACVPVSTVSAAPAINVMNLDIAGSLSQQWLERDALRSVFGAHGKRSRSVWVGQRHSGVFALRIHHVKIDAEIRLALFIKQPLLNG